MPTKEAKDARLAGRSAFCLSRLDCTHIQCKMTRPAERVTACEPLTNQQLECFMAKANLTAQIVREFLSYDQTTGVFTVVSSGHKSRVGSPIGGADQHGYIIINVQRRPYGAHRLAWLLMTGEWPSMDIDHVNGDKSDNRWSNLRHVDRSVNAQNRRVAHRNNTAGLLGVSWHKGAKKWVAHIMSRGARHYLGLFVTKEDAHAEYLAAKRRLHEGCTI